MTTTPMEIRQDTRPERYSIVANNLIEHTELSLEAKAIMIYLLSRTKDWKIRITDVERFAKCGKEKRQRIFRELGKAGYLELITTHGRDGRIVKYYQIHRDGGTKVKSKKISK